MLARDVVLGTVLAFHLGVLARPLAPFSFLIAGVYAAAAITANFTDGVAALIVALRRGHGCRQFAGIHRGLLAVLAAALIGSFEPAPATLACLRTGLAVLGGCLYGLLLVRTVARPLVARPLAVHSTTALGYSRAAGGAGAGRVAHGAQRGPRAGVVAALDGGRARRALAQEHAGQGGRAPGAGAGGHAPGADAFDALQSPQLRAALRRRRCCWRC